MAKLNQQITQILSSRENTEGKFSLILKPDSGGIEVQKVEESKENSNSSVN